MRDGIRQQTVIRFLRNGMAGKSRHFRCPRVRNRVARQFHHVEPLRKRCAVQRDEVSEFLNRRRGVLGSQLLVVGFEEDVQVHAGFVALIFLENAGNNGAGETRLGINEGKRLGGKAVGIRLIRRRIVSNRRFSASDHQHVRGDSNANSRREPVEPVSAHREPPSGVEQIAGVVANGSEFQAGHGAVVRAFDLAFVFEGERGGCVFRQASRKRHAYGRILRNPLGG